MLLGIQRFAIPITVYTKWKCVSKVTFKHQLNMSDLILSSMPIWYDYVCDLLVHYKLYIKSINELIVLKAIIGS